ncbi:MAG: hypothetical protein HOO19_01580 [Rhodospirillaceae bacterium]|jgi:hypothetical protein|nr:hypothetical protein [Rhodospirillaceae bacterium]MBT3884084.1 hypothetical protein [Rhodospirillaceae bacterium]MBT4119170.1 hypothetical protein [Rhodospirillaceae bacterium]MBT4673213.1 hypothetical protein [Rhodospirillaceae bacterium]MBT4721064.1 hypothetical protein [Rhodospirillaceae bacterium]
MTERNDQLIKIHADLERHIELSCAATGSQKASDFSAESCNDAYLMLHEAAGGLAQDNPHTPGYLPTH